MQICLDGRMTAERSVVALGMFDGVHIGHRVLLQKARALADQQKATMVVQTFTTHPLSLIRPEAAPPMLTTLEERVKLIEEQGADIFSASPFTEKIQNTPPADFVGRLVQRWHPVAVVVGFNHTFGRKGEGTPALLAALGQALGFETYVVPEIRLDGETVSSSRVRHLLLKGDMVEARKLLGHSFTRQAEVAARNGEVCELVCMPNGKLNLPEGRYRAVMDDSQHRWPVSLSVLPDGRLRGNLPESLALRTEVTLEFLA